MDFNSKDTHNDKSKLKKTDEIRIEPPVPVEHVIKSNVEIKEEQPLKVDSGYTISKDAIKREDEELEKRPEIELLEKLKNHEDEEKKILAESKQILEELKGARQKQFEKNKRKPIKQLIELNSIKSEEKKDIKSSNDNKNQIEDVVKDKLPLPLVLKEANKSYNTKLEAGISRDKRDLTSTMHNSKEENCDKNNNNKSKYDSSIDVKK